MNLQELTANQSWPKHLAWGKDLCQYTGLHNLILVWFDLFYYLYITHTNIFSSRHLIRIIIKEKTSGSYHKILKKTPISSFLTLGR